MAYLVRLAIGVLLLFLNLAVCTQYAIIGFGSDCTPSGQFDVFTMVQTGTCFDLLTSYDCSGNAIVENVYSNFSCSGAPTTVTLNQTCIAEEGIISSSWSCGSSPPVSPNGYYVVSTYTNSQCSGDPVSVVGNKLGICYGSNGNYISYTCSSTQYSLSTCTDSACQQCTTQNIPLETGCFGNIRLQCTTSATGFTGGGGSTTGSAISLIVSPLVIMLAIIVALL